MLPLWFLGRPFFIVQSREIILFCLHPLEIPSACPRHPPLPLLSVLSHFSSLWDVSPASLSSGKEGSPAWIHAAFQGRLCLFLYGISGLMLKEQRGEKQHNSLLIVQDGKNKNPKIYGKATWEFSNLKISQIPKFQGLMFSPAKLGRFSVLWGVDWVLELQYPWDTCKKAKPIRWPSYSRNAIEWNPDLPGLSVADTVMLKKGCGADTGCAEGRGVGFTGRKMQPDPGGSSSFRHTLILETGNWALHLSTDRRSVWDTSMNQGEVWWIHWIWQYFTGVNNVIFYSEGDWWREVHGNL